MRMIISNQITSNWRCMCFFRLYMRHSKQISILCKNLLHACAGLIHILLLFITPAQNCIYINNLSVHLFPPHTTLKCSEKPTVCIKSGHSSAQTYIHPLQPLHLIKAGDWCTTSTSTSDQGWWLMYNINLYMWSRLVTDVHQPLHLVKAGDWCTSTSTSGQG